MANHELEFFPAALEIQETPPLLMSRYIQWAIMLFFAIAVVWAIIGQVDIVGVARGKIVPSGRVKIIQPLETGVVRTIYVREGERVQVGQPLMELDATLTDADLEQIEDQQLALQLERARLLTILDQAITSQVTDEIGSKTGDREQSPRNNFKALIKATAAQIFLQRDRAHSQVNEFHAKNEALRHEKRQRNAELNAIDQRIQQLDATIPLITERANSIADLLKKELASRVQWLELEQDRIEQVKERDVQRSNYLMLEASIANVDQRLTAQRAEFESRLLTELADLENRITAFEQELIKAEKRVTLQKLVAPVAGKIHQLTIHTIGGVVTPAQELMHIIPDENAVEIEAWLPNKDIGFVHEGQQAEIKIETFPFTKYGTIEGELIMVSNDATPDENLGLVYAIKVKMDRTIMRVEEKTVNLSPGMAVTVEVNMGKRRLIEYLTSPLLRYKDESARER